MDKIKGFTLLECVIASLLSLIILSLLFSILYTYKKAFLIVSSLGRVQKNMIIALTSLENDIKNNHIQFENKILILKAKNYQIQYFIADTQRKDRLNEPILGL